MQVNLSTIMLQAAPQPGFGGPVLLMVGMFVVMYFFMIRPQQKRQKEAKKFSDTVNVGDQIVTIAGIHGKISRFNEDGTVKIEIGHGSFMTIDRSAISMDMTVAHQKKTATATAGSVVVAK